jgi:hypothetical protein
MDKELIITLKRTDLIVRIVLISLIFLFRKYKEIYGITMFSMYVSLITKAFVVRQSIRT